MTFTAVLRNTDYDLIIACMLYVRCSASSASAPVGRGESDDGIACYITFVYVIAIIVAF